MPASWAPASPGDAPRAADADVENLVAEALALDKSWNWVRFANIG